METIKETMQLVMLRDYLRERAQERKRKQSGGEQQPQRKRAVLRSRRQMVGRVLMVLGKRLSGMGGHLLGEALEKELSRT